MADAFIVSHFINADALGSIGASSSVQFLVLGFCIGYGNGLAIPVAHAVGAGRKDTASKYIVNGVWVAVMLSILLATVFSVLTRHILWVLQTPEVLLSNAYTYLLISFVGIPATVAYNHGASVLRSTGNSRDPFLYLAISAVFNIFLDLLFIVCFSWGVAGAAVATVIAQCLSAVLCYSQVTKQKLASHSGHMPDSTSSLYLLSVGIPMGLQYSITAIGAIIVQSANNALGEIYTVAFAAGSKIRQFFMCPFDAIAAGASVYAGQNKGAGNLQRAQSGVRSGMFMGVLYGIIGGIVMAVGAETFANLFLNESNTVTLSAVVRYLRCVGCFLWLLGILNVYRMSIQGLGYTNLALGSGIVELCSRIILCVFFVPVYQFNAVCFNEPFAWLCAAVYVIVVFRFAIRKEKRGMPG